ncbi:V-set and immunoglobulin domain-containing protein 1-like [Etheostoma cragini]|uniref:V-set and immunoglobulin domain-containing protein 1-like n=1 Tax=Etheostoma cragini TaxID=417921 RepID=UPI00155E12C4|nr:V-set and immunoglobulin domain-containing protein 1-like [Etheostoma cragini]
MGGTETRTCRLNGGPLQLLFLVWVLVLSGLTLGQEQGPGVMKEDSDVVLPCFLSTMESVVMSMVPISLLSLRFFMGGTETTTCRLIPGLRKLLILFCLLVLSGLTLGQQQGSVGVKVVVREDSDVVLPCSLSTKESIVTGVFDWIKVPQKDEGLKEVFLYNAGIHYNNGRPGQSEEFKGRVFHFPDELKHSNASITIRNTKISDSGVYSCDFPRFQPRQTFYINLLVAASPEPCIRTLNATSAWAHLQCEVRGASPKPKLEWRDGAENPLPAEEPQTSEKRGRFYITLITTVNQTGRYRCVVTQEEISHQTQAETFVHISGKVCEDSSSEVVVGWIGGLVLGVLVHALVLALLVVTKIISVRCNKGSCQQGNGLHEVEKGNHRNGLGNHGNGSPEEGSEML